MFLSQQACSISFNFWFKILDNMTDRPNYMQPNATIYETTRVSSFTWVIACKPSSIQSAWIISLLIYFVSVYNLKNFYTFINKCTTC